MAVLGEVLSEVGGRVLWQHPIYGQPVGEQAIDEVLAAWYPSHQAFLDLLTAPGSEENFRLRGLAVEDAVIHRCPGDQYPFEPMQPSTKIVVSGRLQLRSHAPVGSQPSTRWMTSRPALLPRRRVTGRHSPKPTLKLGPAETGVSIYLRTGLAGAQPSTGRLT